MAAFAVASSLLFRFFVAIIRRYCLGHNVRGSDNPVRFRMRVESLQEDDHGGVDHLIWLIDTAGLDQPDVESLRFVSSKRGGLIDGTECTICLGKFELDEDLWLLLKCSQAFHVPCINTWLRLHKNCPLCRALIVRAVPLPCCEINLEESGSNRETLERSSAMVSGNVDAGEPNSEEGSGCRGENEVRKEPKRTSLSMGSSSVTGSRRITAVGKCSFAKEAKNERDAVCTRKNGESSWNRNRRSSSDAGKPAGGEGP